MSHLFTARRIHPDQWPMSGVSLLDIRPVSVFQEGFIAGSRCLPEIEEQFEVTLRKIWPNPGPVVLVTQHATVSAKVVKAIHNLGAIVTGWMLFADWAQTGRETLTLQKVALKDALASGHPLLDARTEAEWLEARIPDAKNIPILQMEPLPSHLASNASYVTYCAGLYRALNLAAQLRSKGLSVQFSEDGLASYRAVTHRPTP